MTTSPIRLGISTCPNDTFAFHAILERKIDLGGLDFQIELLDIQQLNERLFQGDFDVAKCSFHAALLLADRTWVLPSGSALGFGVGPLLLAKQSGILPQESGRITLCPGEHTTATMLLKLFYPEASQVEQVVFSEIMPRLQDRTADFGVCIHEGRFTWQQQGLALIEDLGTRWERETSCPLPLGGLVASRNLPSELTKAVQSVVQRSIQYAKQHPQETLPTMRHYAQEFSDEVLMQHVDLYVNDWTVDLGEVGRKALAMLNQKAISAGLIQSDTHAIEVFLS
ncbi:1,4-dihydroxy-6-naphthoate synthase [Stieleria sp. JC731]|uniref:1,4-dihydroxy-6-naphthoate synthase n=1 Tax=Pirellulaceae TaxID=2691357 RepID=UPI001E53FADD|nr:1,4-dihydroxy-6-naphthoate synthase [Stieleria sp. JC731]MCC9601874.1 1,4-dihydroxy-6-naphthoate synthase [Stieleria sp. JC731]